MVKNMLSKSSNTRSFQEVLADLRTTRIGMGLPSPAEILHGRNLTTRVQAEIDIKAIRSVLQERQLKMTLDHNSSRRAKKARPLVVGERCHVLGPGNKWIDAFVTGITDSGRSYETQVEATGKQLTRNRSHIRPRSPDIPHMHASFLQHNAVPSATSDGNALSERQNSVISGCQQLANGQKTVLSGNHKGSIKQTNTSQVLVSETVPDRRVQPSRQAKMTRFGDNPVTSTVSIPPRRQPGRDTSTRNRREFKLNVTDPDLLIPIKQTRVTTRHSDLREPQPSSSDSQPASSQPVTETTTSESSVSLPSSPSGSSSTESTSTSGTDSSSSETSSESSSQPSSNASSTETSSSASTSRSTSPELLEMERSFNSLLAGTRDRQGHPVTRSQIVDVMFLTSNLSQIGNTYQSVYLVYFEGPRLRLAVDSQKITVVRESYSRMSGTWCSHPSRKAKLLGYNDVPTTHVIFIMIGLRCISALLSIFQKMSTIISYTCLK